MLLVSTWVVLCGCWLVKLHDVSGGSGVYGRQCSVQSVSRWYLRPHRLWHVFGVRCWHVRWRRCRVLHRVPGRFIHGIDRTGVVCELCRGAVFTRWDHALQRVWCGVVQWTCRICVCGVSRWVLRRDYWSYHCELHSTVPSRCVCVGVCLFVAVVC